MAQVQVSHEGRVQGVVLQDGEEVRSKVVLSNASPQTTFLKLTPQVRPGVWARCVCRELAARQGLCQDCGKYKHQGYVLWTQAARGEVANGEEFS